MIVTSRKETFYKVEMTSEQAIDLLAFLSAIQSRHFAEILQMIDAGNMQERDRIMLAVSALRISLKERDG